MPSCASATRFSGRSFVGEEPENRATHVCNLRGFGAFHSLPIPSPKISGCFSHGEKSALVNSVILMRNRFNEDEILQQCAQWHLEDLNTTKTT